MGINKDCGCGPVGAALGLRDGASAKSGGGPSARDISAEGTMDAIREAALRASPSQPGTSEARFQNNPWGTPEPEPPAWNPRSTPNMTLAYEAGPFNIPTNMFEATTPNQPTLRASPNNDQITNAMIAEAARLDDGGRNEQNWQSDVDLTTSDEFSQFTNRGPDWRERELPFYLDAGAIQGPPPKNAGFLPYPTRDPESQLATRALPCDTVETYMFSTKMNLPCKLVFTDIFEGAPLPNLDGDEMKPKLTWLDFFKENRSIIDMAALDYWKGDIPDSCTPRLLAMARFVFGEYYRCQIVCPTQKMRILHYSYDIIYSESEVVYAHSQVLYRTRRPSPNGGFDYLDPYYILYANVDLLFVLEAQFKVKIWCY